MSSHVFVYTVSRSGEVGAWSRYLFPFDVSNFSRVGESLYIRAGDDILLFDPQAVLDYNNSGSSQNYNCTVQWPWLDMGRSGVTKLLAGIDMVVDSTGNPSISLGYDETNTSAYTAAYSTVGDTYPGQYIPLTLMVPSISPKLTFTGANKWTVYALTLYVEDERETA